MIDVSFVVASLAEAKTAVVTVLAALITFAAGVYGLKKVRSLLGSGSISSSISEPPAFVAPTYSGTEKLTPNYVSQEVYDKSFGGWGPSTSPNWTSAEHGQSKPTSSSDGFRKSTHFD